LGTEPNFEKSWPETVARFLINDSHWMDNFNKEQQLLVKQQAPKYRFCSNRLHRRVTHETKDILVPYLTVGHREKEI
jgi:hypothetical protein